MNFPPARLLAFTDLGRAQKQHQRWGCGGQAGKTNLKMGSAAVAVSAAAITVSSVLRTVKAEPRTLRRFEAARRTTYLPSRIV
jgi:hypothetical protein